MAKQNQKQKSRRQKAGDGDVPVNEPSINEPSIFSGITSFFTGKKVDDPVVEEKPDAAAVVGKVDPVVGKFEPVEEKSDGDPSAVGGKKHKKSSKKSRSKKSRARKHKKSVKR